MGKSKSKKRATKRTPKPFTPAEVQQIVAGAVARWQRMARGIPDPPGTEVIEATFEDAPPVSEAERQSGIRLHKRLVDLERLSHRIIENPETTARRRELAEQILRGVRTARALWESGTRPDAMMGPIERTVATLDFLTIYPLAAKGHRFKGVQQPKGELWEAVIAVLDQEPPRLKWRDVMRAVVPRLPQATLTERGILTYGTGGEITPESFEYGWDGVIQFRRDIESYVSREVVELVTVPGRVLLPPVEEVTYHGFIDPAGGSGPDAFTWGIAHQEERGGRRAVILDACEERRPPFSPETTTRECSGHLRAYGITTVTGDRYAGAWPSEQFQKYGIRYEPSEAVKSDIYRDALPLLTSGLVELLDLPRLAAQLGQLERRTARGGRDSIDHGPNGHDDLMNSALGAVRLAASGRRREPARLW